MKVFIYCLVDPRTDEVRYVGYSKYPERRYRGHLRDSCKAPRSDWDSHKCCWIRSVVEAGLKPTLVIVCILQTHAEAQRVEVALIACFIRRGIKLTNGTVGGDGGSQGEAARLKMRLAKLGKKQNPEHVNARREAHRIGANRRFRDPEQRKKAAEQARAQWANPVDRAKRVAAITAANVRRFSPAEKI